MPVWMIKLVIALVFGPPLMAGLVALLFADVWLARMDGRKTPTQKIKSSSRRGNAEEEQTQSNTFILSRWE